MTTICSSIHLCMCLSWQIFECLLWARHCVRCWGCKQGFMCLTSFYTYITDEETEAESNLYSHLATQGRKYSWTQARCLLHIPCCFPAPFCTASIVDYLPEPCQVLKIMVLQILKLFMACVPMLSNFWPSWTYAAYFTYWISVALKH